MFSLLFLPLRKGLKYTIQSCSCNITFHSLQSTLTPVIVLNIIHLLWISFRQLRFLHKVKQLVHTVHTQTRNNNTWCVHICVWEPLYLAFSISLKSLKHSMCMFSCTVRICVVVHLCISVWRLINSQDRNTQGLRDYKFYNWGLHALCMQKPQLGTNGDASMSVAAEAEINCSTDQQSSLSFWFWFLQQWISVPYLQHRLAGPIKEKPEQKR